MPRHDKQLAGHDTRTHLNIEQGAWSAAKRIAYPRANLEHAAASVANIMQGAMLVTLLGLMHVATTTPEVSLLGIHPLSFALPVAYV